MSNTTNENGRLLNQHLIPKEAGAEMVAAMKHARRANISIPEFYDFDKSLFEFLLSTDRVSGIRIYPAVKNGEMCFVITATDDGGNDIYPEHPDHAEEGIDTLSDTRIQREGNGSNPVVGDMGSACPIYPAPVGIVTLSSSIDS